MHARGRPSSRIFLPGGGVFSFVCLLLLFLSLFDIRTHVCLFVDDIRVHRSVDRRVRRDSRCVRFGKSRRDGNYYQYRRDFRPTLRRAYGVSVGRARRDLISIFEKFVVFIVGGRTRYLTVPFAVTTNLRTGRQIVVNARRP